MTLSDFRHITDELLSAYIDDEVTEQERSLIEAAIAQDEEIAWRLNSLRQTVSLLQELPELALPRAFALTLEQLQIAQPAESTAQPIAVPLPQPAAPVLSPQGAPQVHPQVQEEAGFWARLQDDWRSFWQGGNPLLRNAAAVSFALMLVLTGAGQMLTRTMMQPAGMMATSSAPAAAEIALAPSTTEVMADSAANQATDSETGSEGTADAAMARMAPAALPEETSGASVAAVQASEAAVEEAAIDSTDQSAESANSMAMQAAPVAAPVADEAAAEAEAPEQPAVAAASMAPEESADIAAASSPEDSEQPAQAYTEPPPLVSQPIPGGLGRGQGGGGGDGLGGDGLGAPGDTSLVPPDSYTFDVNPAGEVPPPQEAVVASAAVAAAPAASEEVADEPMAEATIAEATIAEASVADIAGTPAVDAIEESTESAESTEREGAPAEAVLEDVATKKSEPEAVDATTEPTPEAVALAAPQNITSSQVVENVATEGTVSTDLSADSPASNLPLLWIAQGTTLLLTVVLASLWWRSRRANQGLH